MNELVQALRQHEALIWACRFIVWAAAGYLFVLGSLIFVHPAIVNRFFAGLGSSFRINFIEAALRLIVGLAFMGISPETKLPFVVFCFGAVLAATAIPLMFLYELHTRQRTWVIPLTKRILPLMGITALGLCALIVWALI